MTSQGSAYARFQRALRTRDLALIRAAACELPQVDLGDALTVCMAIRDAEPQRFQRAALRWIARFAVERAMTVHDVRAAVDAFDAMAERPQEALETLGLLCRARR